MPKTVYFNFRVFPFRTAIRLPVLISYDTKLIELHKYAMKFNCVPYTFIVKIGFGGSDGIVPRKGSLCLETGCITFDGKATFAQGISIRNSGKMNVGDDYFANRNCTIWCSEEITFGNHVLLGWNITFRDSDGHMILKNGVGNEIKKSISIGKHSWICSESHVLKGARMGADSVLAYNSVLLKPYEQNNVLLAGQPAKIIEEKINWERG